MHTSFCQETLGYYYQDGKGVAKDDTAALECFRKAAQGGRVDSQYNLGICYEIGRGCFSDVRKAADYYRMAAEKDLVIAQERLGYCYQKGLGVEINEEIAAAWYNKGADQGNALAQRWLAFLIFKKQKKVVDLDKAKTLLDKARKQGERAAILYWHKKFFFTSLHLGPGCSKECFYPLKLPPIIDQAGPYCGSAALAAAGNYAQGKNLFASSLEQKMDGCIKDAAGVVVLDKLQETEFRSKGPQYSIHSFTAVARIVGIEGGEPVVKESYTEAEYTKTLCNANRNRKVVILPFDLENFMPAEKKGLQTHWTWVLVIDGMNMAIIIYWQPTLVCSANFRFTISLFPIVNFRMKIHSLQVI